MVGTREPLTRERVVAGAVALADEHGVGALTIRALATRLGVKPMAIYHHVANKDEILDAIVDAVFHEIELPMVGAPWRPELERRSRSARAVLRRHPWALALLESRRHPGPSTLRHHDAVVGVLLEAGFSVHAAARAFALLDSYVYGFVLQEVALPFEPSEAADFTADVLEGPVAGEHPYLTRLATELVQAPGYGFADEFEPGLAVVLDGTAALRAPG